MSMATLIGNEVLSTEPRRGLVFLATHKGDGNRLPYMNRSFISFSYGGRFIEEFDLIATFSGDRLLRLGYAQFEDNITSYSNLDGLYYWGTHFKSNTIEFTLSTDGIDLKKLDDFLYWFRAGETKELILAEHPNRATLARVSEPPQLNLLPFEGPINITISNLTYKTSTTLYKGDITISFIMDEPHWYALENLLGRKDGDRYIDEWKPPELPDIPSNYVNIFASLDALKILYEDGIPLGSMFDENMLLGNGAFAQVRDDNISMTWDNNTITAESINWSDSSTKYACTDDSSATYKCGTIAGAIVDASGNGIQEMSSGVSNAGYFYYSGNAPAFTVISFTMPLEFANDYVKVPSNSYYKTSNKEYSTITIESVHKLELRFTTPNYLTSYNKAIEIMKKAISASSTYSPESIRAILRDNVHHIYARSWAIHCVDICTNSNGGWTNISNLLTEMRKFLVRPDDALFSPKLTVTFNSLTGEAKGKMQYYTLNSNNSWVFPSGDNYIEENVGDMLRSNHIIIKDRNYPTSQGRIAAWSNNNKELSHRIYHDLPVAISNFSIIYKNMYL